MYIVHKFWQVWHLQKFSPHEWVKTPPFLHGNQGLNFVYCYTCCLQRLLYYFFQLLTFYSAVKGLWSFTIIQINRRDLHFIFVIVSYILLETRERTRVGTKCVGAAVLQQLLLGMYLFANRFSVTYQKQQVIFTFYSAAKKMRPLPNNFEDSFSSAKIFAIW